MTSTSVAQLAAKFDRAANAVPGSLRRGVFEAAMEGKQVARAAYIAAGVSPTGSRLGRWSVGFDMKGTSDPTAVLQVRGRKMHLFDNPTSPHRIAPKARRGKKVVRFEIAASPVFRRAVNHPGTKGARVFHGDAKPVIARRAPEIIRLGFMRGLTSSGFGR